MLEPGLDGAVSPGGCDNCDAEQRLNEVEPGLWTLGIAHDETCPFWQRVQREG